MLHILLYGTLPPPQRTRVHTAKLVDCIWIYMCQKYSTVLAIYSKSRFLNFRKIDRGTENPLKSR